MTDKKHVLISAKWIERALLVIRGEKVMFDTDQARLYGVSTKRFNEQVKRNKARFPDNFHFQLTPAEKAEVVANCGHLANLKFSTTLPFAFTEHGALMSFPINRTYSALRSNYSGTSIEFPCTCPCPVGVITEVRRSASTVRAYDLRPNMRV